MTLSVRAYHHPDILLVKWISPKVHRDIQNEASVGRGPNEAYQQALYRSSDSNMVEILSEIVQTASGCAGASLDELLSTPVCSFLLVIHALGTMCIPSG